MNHIAPVAPGATESIVSQIPFIKILSGSGVVALIGGVLTAIWNSRAPMKKIQVEHDQKFLEGVLGRVDKLEQANERLRNDYENKIQLISSENDVRETANEARTSLIRHELNNVRTCFNMLVMSLRRMKDKPEELVGIISDIQDMRNEQIKREEIEQQQVAQYLPRPRTLDPKTQA